MKKPKKRGRPNGYNLKMAERIIALAKGGDTDEVIADKIGISKRTLSNWKGAHPDLLQAVEASKRTADDLVEASLYQRAIGYTHKAIKVQWDSERGEWVTFEYEEHVPPSEAAMRLWLMNRRPKRWREKQTVEHEGKVGLEALVLGSMKKDEKE